MSELELEVQLMAEEAGSACDLCKRRDDNIGGLESVTKDLKS